MAKNDASEPEGAASPAPAEAKTPRRRAATAADPAIADQSATLPPAKRAPRAPKAAADPHAAPASAASKAPGPVAPTIAADQSAEDAPGAPRVAKLAPIRRLASAALAIAKRPKVALIGGAILIVGLNTLMAIVVDGWKSADADLRAENTALGQELANAQATNAFQKAQLALFTSQQAAAAALADELEPVAAEQRDVSDALKAAGINLRTCVNDRGTLIANLWVSTASAQAGFEAEVNAECTAAQTEFTAIGEDD